MDAEIDQSFCSFDEWRSWVDDNPSPVSEEFRTAFANRIRIQGFIEPITAFSVRPEDVTVPKSGFREGIVYHGINSRVRAVMRAIETTFDVTDVYNLRVYASEGLTDFALRMRGIFPKFIGSEYTDQADIREWMKPIPFEDLEALSFESNFFDLVSTNEVLEHVPSIDRALAELCRVLKPGGWHIGTVPFRFMDTTSEVKATLQNGKVHYLTKPEYHGNPMTPEGSLVFELPGWDILDRARSVGFSKATMRFIASAKYGSLSDHSTGVFVLSLQK